MNSEVEIDFPNDAERLPPCRVLVRSKHALELYTLGNGITSCATTPPEEERKVTLCIKPCTSTIPLCTALDGSFTLMHVSTVGIVKCNLLTSRCEEQFFAQSTINVQMMSLSPLGNFLLTWEKQTVETTSTNTATSSSSSSKNLKLWCMTSGMVLASFAQKSLSRDSWPYFQFTYNEDYAFLQVNQTQIRVYNVQQDILPQQSSATATTTTGVSETNRNTNNSEPRFCSKLQIPCTILSVQNHVAMTSSIAAAVSIPPVMTNCYYFTTFVGKTKDKPAMASIYSYTPSTNVVAPSNGIEPSNDDDTTPRQAEVEFTKIASKSLFQAEECNTKWSPSIQQPPACLLTLSVAIDTTGQSYYGNSQLYLWNAANSTKTAVGNELIAVPLPQNGPVLSCQWIPDPNKPVSFVVIAGKIPPMTSQHHGITGDVTFLYGNNVSRNTLISAPHGRFLCTAGFGNMPGGMSFWDVNKKKLLPHSSANISHLLKSDTPVTMYSWSPDSRYFITATTTPRMNVDNGIHLYKYTGELISAATTKIIPWSNKDYQPNHLYEAIFVPSLLHVYPDRPQSPVPEGLTTADSTVSTTTAIAPIKSTAYIPPSARKAMGSTVTGNSLAERLRREKEGTVQGATKVVNNSTTSSKNVAATHGNRVIPGLTQPTNTKTKSQLKREKLKQKLEQQPTTTTATSSTPSSTAIQVPSVKATATKPNDVGVVSAPAAAAVTATDTESVDVEKRVRKLKKILKQIEDLKLISELNDDQKAKIASESTILSELEQLGV